MADTTKNIIKYTQSVFQANNFDSAYDDLEKARKSLRDRNFESTVSRSITSLESTMRICHDKLGEPLPNKKQITNPWKSTRDILYFLELDSSGVTSNLISSLTGIMIHLGGLRNELSDVHRKGVLKIDVSENIAGFALNTSATLSTFIIRRYNQIKTKNKLIIVFLIDHIANKDSYFYCMVIKLIRLTVINSLITNILYSFLEIIH